MLDVFYRENALYSRSESSFCLHFMLVYTMWRLSHRRVPGWKNALFWPQMIDAEIMLNSIGKLNESHEKKFRIFINMATNCRELCDVFSWLWMHEMDEIDWNWNGCSLAFKIRDGNRFLDAGYCKIGRTGTNRVWRSIVDLFEFFVRPTIYLFFRISYWMYGKCWKWPQKLNLLWTRFLHIIEIRRRVFIYTIPT